MPSDTVAFPADVLTEIEAAGRAARVSGTSYEVALDLQQHAATFRGEVRLRFPVRGEGDLFLDFRGGTIERLEVNGRPVRPERPGHRILLPRIGCSRRRRSGSPTRTPTTRAATASTGSSTRRTARSTLYSNFEPFEAHRLFPCFDQPDLKGTYAFTVTAPAAWAVISNGPEILVEDAPDGRRVHRFAPTPPISTYLTAVIAGPYRWGRTTSSGASRSGCGAGVRWSAPPRPRRAVRGDEAGPRLLRRPLRPAVPVRQVRPGLRARVQLRGDGERGLQSPTASRRLPRPADGHPAPGARRDRPPRARPHVVRRPGHDALVGRPVAERELRHLRLATSPWPRPPASRVPGAPSTPR